MENGTETKIENTKAKVKTKEIARVEGNSPADMIRMAVSGGADLDKLEKLLALQERYEANEARKAYHKAMADFKENPPKIQKDKTVKYKEVKYNHASLANVVEKITKSLSEHGLSASFKTQQNGKISVTCKITHVQGHSEETTLSADSDTSGSKNSIQAIGSTVTYLERYTLLAALGLATYDTEDDDAVSAEDPLITDEQLATLGEYIIQYSVNEKRFLQFLKVESLSQITQSQYANAVKAIQAKGAKK